MLKAVLSDQAVNIRYCYESAGGALPINIRDYESAAEIFLVRINMWIPWIKESGFFFTEYFSGKR